MNTQQAVPLGVRLLPKQGGNEGWCTAGDPLGAPYTYVEQTETDHTPVFHATEGNKTPNKPLAKNVPNDGMRRPFT